MEKKFTKGEWFPNVISGITIGVNAIIEKNDVGVYSQNVCEFILPNSVEEYKKERTEIEANAKLIAAVPEMFESIDTFVSAINMVIDNEDNLSPERMKVYQDIKESMAFQQMENSLKKATE